MKTHQQPRQDVPVPAPEGSAGTGTRTALVLGATGGIGGEVARGLRQRGWAVRALHRQAGERAAGAVDGLQWTQGNAMDPARVAAAARGVDLLVHAVNPPGYRRWNELVLPMLDNSIAAARAAGALLLLPGTVYNFGPDAGAEPDEQAPQNPVTRKGRIRAEMERRLHAAVADGGLRSLVVRAGDFFGPRAANNWFSQGLVKPGRPVASITNPARAGVGHQWAYLPDVARTMLELLEREQQLPAFAVYHFHGHWDPDGAGFPAAIRRVVGNPTIKVRAFPWWLVGAAAPVVPLFRELKEMRYLWETPLRMRNHRLLQTLDHEPHTPCDEAIRATLTGLDCLEADPPTAPGEIPPWEPAPPGYDRFHRETPRRSPAPSRA